MYTNVSLQELFTYSLFPLIIMIVLIGIMTGYIIYLANKKENKKVEKQEYKVKVIPEKNIKDIPVIKNKYLKQLDIIEDKYNSDRTKLREAYLSISETIRLFVFEVTDITTQNYSLSEIKELNIPSLYELIKEYYVPEFASKSEGDFGSSINKARRVISEWN